MIIVLYYTLTYTISRFCILKDDEYYEYWDLFSLAWVYVMHIKKKSLSFVRAFFFLSRFFFFFMCEIFYALEFVWCLKSILQFVLWSFCVKEKNMYTLVNLIFCVTPVAWVKELWYWVIYRSENLRKSTIWKSYNGKEKYDFEFSHFWFWWGF